MNTCIRRQYVDTPDGQIHITEAGQGRSLILLPWFPMSSRFYIDELPILAELGWHAVAVDPMGQGRSGSREAGWSITRHADAIASALSQMSLKQPVVLGGHMGGRIAIDLAGRPELGISILALDAGLAMPTAPAGAAPLEAPAKLPSESAVFLKALRALEVLSPCFVVSDKNLHRVHRLMADILDAGVPAGPDVSPGFDPAAHLKKLTLPVIALTAETDPLRATYRPTIRAAAYAIGHVFAGDHPLHDVSRVGEYARTVIDLIDRIDRV